MVGVDIEPLSSERPFQAEAIMRALPGLRVALCDTATAHYERTPALAAESDGSIGLIVNLAPKAIASQRDESLVLTPGDAAAVLTEEAGKLTGTRHLGLMLPRDVLASRVDDPPRPGLGSPHPEGERSRASNFRPKPLALIPVSGITGE